MKVMRAFLQGRGVMKSIVSESKQKTLKRYNKKQACNGDKSTGFFVKHYEREGLVLSETEQFALLAGKYSGILYNKILTESG